MITLTDHILETAPEFDMWIRDGIDAALAGVRPNDAYKLFGVVRGRHGFSPVPRRLLTWPSDNAKTDMSVVPAYGLTLQHFRIVLEACDHGPIHYGRITLNACPNAGHCVKVCVLDNGKGAFPTVQRARLSRVDLMARHPREFAQILTFELVAAVRKHGRILWRPDMNSNVEWQRIAPSLVNGYLPGIMIYGYSKIPTVLDGNGWLGSVYKVAYSWNERSDASAVGAFIARGGAVAVVTARGKTDPVLSSMPFDYGTAPVVNADLTDEWILSDHAVVGDLSAKGKARSLIGKSDFVVVPLVSRKRLAVRAA